MSLDILRANDQFPITIANGATSSSIFALGSAPLGSLHLPAGLQGNLKMRHAHHITDTYNYVYPDNAITHITQSTAALTKPCKIALRPEFMVAKLAVLVMTSAQTAAKSLTLFQMG